MLESCARCIFLLFVGAVALVGTAEGQGDNEPSPSLRLEVMRNVWEEHGEGDEAKVHGQTFLELLLRLGEVSPAALNTRPLWPEVRAFNTTLTGCSMADDWEVATACFGTIERMFVDISQWLGQAIVERDRGVVMPNGGFDLPETFPHESQIVVCLVRVGAEPHDFLKVRQRFLEAILGRSASCPSRVDKAG